MKRNGPEVVVVIVTEGPGLFPVLSSLHSHNVFRRLGKQDEEVLTH